MSLDSSKMESAVGQARDIIFTEFVDERTNLIYDFRDPDRDRHLPTPAEIADEVPNACGWGTGFEDTAIAGGAFLEGLVRGWQQTGDKALAERARKIWQGLKVLGTVSPTRGYVCRGVLPADGKSHYANSSGDQYTLFCSGLYRYLESGLASDEDRRAIADMAAGVCEFVLHADMQILREDGDPGMAGGVGRDETVEGRKVRVAGPGGLQYLALAAAATGESHWQQEYERVRDAYDRLPLRRLATEFSDEALGRKCVYILMQAAYLFRMLFDFEQDEDARKVYAQVLDNMGRYSVRLLDQFRPQPPRIGLGPLPDLDWRKDYRHFHAVNPGLQLDLKARRSGLTVPAWWAIRPGLKNENTYLRQPMEGLTAIMMSEDIELIRQQADKAAGILTGLPLDKVKTSASIFNSEAILWRGRELGVW